MKKMQIEYLNNVTKNCYDEKHISDSFTNYEQILICKEREKHQVFGKFEKMYVAHRDSGKFIFTDCVDAANNSPEAAVFCIRDYLKQIQTDNEKMTEIFRKDYQAYF